MCVFIVLLYFMLFAFLVFFTFVAFFSSVLQYCWLVLLTCKTVSDITYTVLVETLNPAQSINQACELFLTAGISTIMNSVFSWLDGHLGRHCWLQLSAPHLECLPDFL